MDCALDLLTGYICNDFLFSEKMEVPILKKRREVLPVDVRTPNNVCVSSAAAGEAPSSPGQEEEAPPCASNLEDNNLQLEKMVSVNTPGVTLSPRQSLPMNIQPTKEKKCVKLIEVPTISARSGNSPDSPRSVSSFIHASSRLLSVLSLSLPELGCSLSGFSVPRAV